MSLALKPLHPVFVAEATGLDLTQPLSRADACEINAAMNTYGVLVWRGQPLTAQEQIRFASAFGPLDIGLKRIFKRPERLEDERLIDISNVSLDGAVQRRDSPKNLSNFANQLWHSDSSFMNPRAAYSMLHAVDAKLGRRYGVRRFARCIRCAGSSDAFDRCSSQGGTLCPAHAYPVGRRRVHR